MRLIGFLFLFIAISLSTLGQNISSSITHQGGERTFIVHLPNDTEPTSAVPLILAMHGMGDNAQNFSGVGFDGISDTANFIVVYPSALLINIPFSGDVSFWRIGTPIDDNIDDVDFIDKLIDSLMATYNIDPDRIYTTGFSLGGFLSHLIACNLPDRVAAIASHSGTMGVSILSDCNPDRPVPVMHIHGTGDATIAYDGGTFSGVFQYASARDMVELWATNNGCPNPSDSTRMPDIRNDGYTIERIAYEGCNSQSEVIHYKVNGFPHNWLFTNNDLFASDEMWKFFKRHTKQAATAIKPEQQLAGLSLYPNPGSGQFTLNGLQANSLYNIRVTDLQGRTVKQLQFNGSTAQTINLTTLPTGMYHVIVADQNTQYSLKAMVY